jgi:predicted DNA-binding transcriptional regulator AlpA
MKLLSTNEVVSMTSTSRTTIWRYSKKYHDFPKPVTIGGVKRWISHELTEWFLLHRSYGVES